MNRYVVLAFVFMGVCFFELSGGADFDPESVRVATVEARQQRDADRREDLPVQIATLRDAQPAPVTTAAEPEVTRAALNLVSFETVARGTADTETSQPAPTLAAPQPETATAPLVPLEDLAAGRELSLASLETAPQDAQGIVFAGRSSVASSSLAGAARDIRTVKGTLVNMRSGPGTDFDVVDQLEQATEVEVLTDNGDGWVELRPVGSTSRGWIAEFLLTPR